MILSMTPAQARELIGPFEVALEERIVPQAFPECPNSRYQPEYDWLFQYERRIAKFLEPWLRRFRYELIGEKGILCEALSNAFYHGHGKDPEKPIFVRVLVGDHGLVVEIKDSGKGFAVQKVYERFQKRKHYFSAAGNGIRLMAASRRFGIIHAGAGTAFHMLYLFNGDMRNLPGDRILIDA